MEIHQPFTTPIQVSKLNNAELNQELLLYILDKQKNAKGRKISNQGGFQSDIYDIKDNILFEKFINTTLNSIHTLIQNYALSYDYDIIINGIWFNVNPTNSYNLTHTHSGCNFSAAYYINTPKDSGRIVFENPSIGQQTDSFYQNKFREFNNINQGKYYIEPKENILILFPSWLPHYVEQNKSNEDRVGLSFNFSIKVGEKK